jgi:hypothetical protein
MKPSSRSVNFIFFMFLALYKYQHTPTELLSLSYYNLLTYIFSCTNVIIYVYFSYHILMKNWRNLVRQHLIRIPLILWTILVASNAYCEKLTETDFSELRKILTPATDEPWKTIPWQVSLLEAQKMAAQEKKPLFIWAMDGHPLACV